MRMRQRVQGDVAGVVLAVQVGNGLVQLGHFRGLAPFTFEHAFLVFHAGGVEEVQDQLLVILHQVRAEQFVAQFRVGGALHVHLGALGPLGEGQLANGLGAELEILGDLTVERAETLLRQGFVDCQETVPIQGFELFDNLHEAEVYLPGLAPEMLRAKIPTQRSGLPGSIGPGRAQWGPSYHQHADTEPKNRATVGRKPLLFRSRISGRRTGPRPQSWPVPRAVCAHLAAETFDTRLWYAWNQAECPINTPGSIREQARLELSE
jgi:hypothetical protein